MSRDAAAPRPRLRLDQLLVERGLAATRAEAARLILAGRVRLPRGVAAKAGTLVTPDVAVEMAAAPRYVGRGGEKLDGALDALAVSVEGRVAVDVGASTGGFTDCLLARGAAHVHAVDVGRGQLHPRLRADARVTVHEGVNARHLDRLRLDPPPSLATVDVSFISLERILPALIATLVGPGEIVALVKPQFEVGRGRVGKGGVVRSPDLHREAVRRISQAARALALLVGGVAPSPLRGPKGNREFFLLLARDLGARSPLEGAAWEAALEAAVGPSAAPGEAVAASWPARRAAAGAAVRGPA